MLMFQGFGGNLTSKDSEGACSYIRTYLPTCMSTYCAYIMTYMQPCTQDTPYHCPTRLHVHHLWEHTENVAWQAAPCKSLCNTEG